MTQCVLARERQRNGSNIDRAIGALMDTARGKRHRFQEGAAQQEQERLVAADLAAVAGRLAELGG